MARSLSSAMICSIADQRRGGLALFYGGQQGGMGGERGLLVVRQRRRR